MFGADQNLGFPCKLRKTVVPRRLRIRDDDLFWGELLSLGNEPRNASWAEIAATRSLPPEAAITSSVLLPMLPVEPRTATFLWDSDIRFGISRSEGAQV